LLSIYEYENWIGIKLSSKNNIKYDWENGCISFERKERNQKDSEVTIIFVGDISPTGVFQNPMIEGKASILYGNLLKILSSADYRICNLETVLSNKGSPIIKGGPNLSAPPETINGIISGGFNLACLANNHILDYGAMAALDTIELLEENGIAYIGVGNNNVEASRPFIFSIKEHKFAVFNCAEAEEAAVTESNFGACDLVFNHLIIKNIRNIRKDIDFIIVVVHAGMEYTPIASPRIHSLYQSFINAGADIVVGHHPHVPQGIKVNIKSPIAFSLGNFIFPTHKGSAKNNTRKKRREYVSLGYMLKVTFAQRSITNIELIPYRIISGKGVELLSANEKQQFFQQIKRMSAILKEDQLVVKYWETFCQAALEEKYFPIFAGALLNSYSQGKLRRKIKYLHVLLRWLLLSNKKQTKNIAIAQNFLTIPTLYELMIDALKNSKKKIRDNELIVKLLQEWGYKYFG